MQGLKEDMRMSPITSVDFGEYQNLDDDEELGTNLHKTYETQSKK